MLHSNGMRGDTLQLAVSDAMESFVHPDNPKVPYSHAGRTNAIFVWHNERKHGLCGW